MTIYKCISVRRKVTSHITPTSCQASLLNSLSLFAIFSLYRHPPPSMRLLPSISSHGRRIRWIIFSLLSLICMIVILIIRLVTYINVLINISYTPVAKQRGLLLFCPCVCLNLVYMISHDWGIEYEPNLYYRYCMQGSTPG